MATTMKTNKKSTKVESSDNDNQPMEFKAYSRFMRVMNDLIINEVMAEDQVINKISFILFGDSKLDNFKMAAGKLRNFQRSYGMYLMREAAKAAEDAKNSNAASDKK